MSQIFGTRMVRAVDDVTLSIPRGSILGLVGESGCGKSTLSRAIMQLQPVTSGRIVLDGTELTALSPREVRRRRLDFQMVFQDPYASLTPRFSIFSTLAEALGQRKPLPRRGRLVEYGTADAVFHHPPGRIHPRPAGCCAHTVRVNKEKGIV